MKTIELDLEKDQKLDTLTHFLKNKKINLGEEEFLLKIHSTHNIAQLLYAGFLLLLAKYFTEEKNKSTIQNKNGIELHNMRSKIYYEFYLKNNDVNKEIKKSGDDKNNDYSKDNNEYSKNLVQKTRKCTNDKSFKSR